MGRDWDHLVACQDRGQQWNAAFIVFAESWLALTLDVNVITHGFALILSCVPRYNT